MNRYVAFLRGINVGGKNIIRMDQLNSMFVTMGFSGIKTFIQSGNVMFDSNENNDKVIEKKIFKDLKQQLGYPVMVMVRRYEVLENIVRDDPFRGYPESKQYKLYLCLLEKVPEEIPSLPILNEKEGLKVISVKGSEAYIVSYPIKDHYGFPNNFLEKILGMNSTARNWKTILKLIEKKSDNRKS